jgi:hypothetical protein
MSYSYAGSTHIPVEACSLRTAITYDPTGAVRNTPGSVARAVAEEGEPDETRPYGRARYRYCGSTRTWIADRPVRANMTDDPGRAPPCDRAVPPMPPCAAPHTSRCSKPSNRA